MANDDSMKTEVNPADCSWTPDGRALAEWEKGLKEYRANTGRDPIANREWFTAMTVQPTPTTESDGATVCTNGVCVMTDTMMSALNRTTPYPYLHRTPLDSSAVPDAVSRCTLNSDSFFYPIIRADGAIAFTAFSSNSSLEYRWMMMTPADPDALHEVDAIADRTVQSMLFENYYDDDEETHIPSKDYGSYRRFRERRYQSKPYNSNTYESTPIWGNVFGYYTKHVGDDFNKDSGVFKLIEESPVWQRTMTRMMFSVINSLSPFDGNSLLIGNSERFRTTETGWSWFLSLYSDIEHDKETGCRTVLDRGSEYGPGWYALALLYPLLDSSRPQTGTFKDSISNKSARTYFIRTLREMVDPYPYGEDDDAFDDDVSGMMSSGCFIAGRLGLPAALWPECWMAIEALCSNGLPDHDDSLLKSLLSAPLQQWKPLLGFMRLWYGYEDMDAPEDADGFYREPEFPWDYICEQIVHQGLGGLLWYDDGRIDEVSHALSVYRNCLRKHSKSDPAVTAMDWLLEITNHDADDGVDTGSTGYKRNLSWDYNRMATGAIDIRKAEVMAPVKSLWSSR